MGNCLDFGGEKATNEPQPTVQAVKKISPKGPKQSSRGSGTGTTIHSGILQSHNLDVYKKYTEVEVIGKGSMGHVAKVILKEGSLNSSRRLGSATSSIRSANLNKPAFYALKSIILDRISTTFIVELKNEIEILNAMDHPNIVKLHEVITHKKQIYMVQELCDGGDLYTRLPYTEKDAAYITGKLLSAIKYMHDHAIVHRDRE